MHARAGDAQFVQLGFDDELMTHIRLPNANSDAQVVKLPLSQRTTAELNVDAMRFSTAADQPGNKRRP